MWQAKRSLSLGRYDSRRTAKFAYCLFSSTSPSSISQHLTSLTTLSLRLRRFSPRNGRLVCALILKNSQLKTLTVDCNSAELLPFSFHQMPLTQLHELNLRNVSFAPEEVQRTFELLFNCTQLRSLRLIDCLCYCRNAEYGSETAEPSSHRFLQQLVSEMTMLTSLTLSEEVMSLTSLPLSFASHTRLTQLVTWWSEWADLRVCDSLALVQERVDSVRRLYPLQLQANKDLLLSNASCARAAGPEEDPFGYCTMLHIVAARRKLREFPIFLDVLADCLEEGDSLGKSPLMYAAAEKDSEHTVALIAKGANVFHRASGWYGRNALFSAASCLTEENLQVLLTKVTGMSAPERAHLADSLGAIPVMLCRYSVLAKILLADPVFSSQFPLSDYRSYDGRLTLQWLASGLRGCPTPEPLDPRLLWYCKFSNLATALLSAIQTPEDLQRVWESPRQPTTGRTLLMQIAKSIVSFSEPFERELDRVLNFCTKEQLNARDWRGRTAMHRARAAMLRFLLGKSAHSSRFDVNAGSPLFYFLSSLRSERATSFLLAGRADPHAVPPSGGSCLTLLFRRWATAGDLPLSYLRFGAVLNYLVHCKVDPCLPDCEGKTPLHWLCVAVLDAALVPPSFSVSWSSFIRACAPVFLLEDKSGKRALDYLFAESLSLVLKGRFTCSLLVEMLSAGLDLNTSVAYGGASATLGSVLKEAVQSEEALRNQSPEFLSLTDLLECSAPD